MKRLLTSSIFAVVLGMFATVQAQIVDDFDDFARIDTVYDKTVESAPSTLTLTENTTDAHGGTSALDVKAVIGELQKWGSFAQLIYRIEDDDPFLPWASYDTLSIWIKVREAATVPANMMFRIHLADQPTLLDATEEYIYENAVILDAVSEWTELRIPMYEVESDGGVVPGNTGFTRTPDGWGGTTFNDRVLNMDKLVGFNLSIVTSGWDPDANLPADSVLVSFDDMTLMGSRSIPHVFFSGKAVPSALTSGSFGGSTLEIVEGAGENPLTNAIKWTQGDEWGNGWSGIQFSTESGLNMAKSFSTGDTLHLKYKAEAGVNDILVQFETGLWPNTAGKVAHLISLITDDAWHSYAIALDDLEIRESGEIDSTMINNFVIQSNGNAIAGKVIYLDDIWTGEPIIDVVPPLDVTSISVNADDGFNRITWVEVTDEDNATYSIFASPTAITDITDPSVDVITLGSSFTLQGVSHFLTHPLADRPVNYHYAVQVTDSAGNVGSGLTLSTSYTTNLATGVGTISLTPPASFVADGDIDEWIGASIMPIHLDQTTNIPTGDAPDDDADLSGDIYLAMDADFLYFAMDVTDDAVTADASKGFWEVDAVQIFIGLYDGRGAKHTSRQRGTEPDYELTFRPEGFTNYSKSGDFALTPDGTYTDGAGYAYANNTTSYIVEGRIRLDSLLTEDDALFVPANKIRVPIEISIHDADLAAGTRDHVISFSPEDRDNAHITPTVWAYTWVGDSTRFWLDIEEQTSNTPTAFSLSQNYPNPFNPNTTIEYSLATAGHVRVEIYNVLGQQVQVVVDDFRTSGSHKIVLDGRRMASGVYFYRIVTKDFTTARKMILLK